MWCGVFAGVRTFGRDGLLWAEGLQDGFVIGISFERSRFLLNLDFLVCFIKLRSLRSFSLRSFSSAIFCSFFNFSSAILAFLKTDASFAKSALMGTGAA